MDDHVPAQALESPRDDATTRAIASLAERPARLSSLVIDALTDRIVSGAYPPGTLVPPEPMLCRSFDVSRSVVREALKVLEEKSLVTVRRGLGTVVAGVDDWNLLDPVVLAATVRHDERREMIDDLVAVRAALEADMAARAAARATGADVARLRALMRDSESSLADPPRYLALDGAFHDDLMRLSGNRLASATVRSIHDQARASAGYNDPNRGDLELSHRGHVAILDRVAAGEGEAAAAAMREHIVSMWRRKRDHIDAARG